MKFNFFFILLVSPLFSYTQITNSYAIVDAKMDKIPDSLSKSTSLIASYIKENFKQEEEKVRAAFYFTASKISYDTDNMYAINFNETTENKIDKTLKTKKGICINYAEIFNEIASKLKIESVVIEGYTKQNGKADYVAHAWCGAKIAEDWYVFDPTWASGYVNNGKFIKKINNTFYKTDAVKAIASHMPFDYLWQFMGYPITNQEFLEGRTLVNKRKPLFDYYNEIEKYKNQSYIEKLENSAFRIEKNGVKNALIFDRLANKKLEIQNLNSNKTATAYNEVIANFNEAVILLNNFIDYRNKQFKPVFNDAVIKEMAETPRDKILKCKEAVADFKNSDDSNTSIYNSLKKSINESLINANEQVNFVTSYLTKTKAGRKLSFLRKL